MSKIIALLSRKGGNSKTVSTAHLAMCKHLSGVSVACLDLDPEAGLHKLHEMTALPFDVVAGTSSNLKNDLKKLAGYDYVFIDTPPNDEAIVLKVAAIADECIVPCKATIQDLLRIYSTLDAISTIEDARDKALTSVLLTQVKKGTNILGEVRQALIDEQIPLCDTLIHDSVKYQSAMPTHLEEYQAVIKELGL